MCWFSRTAVSWFSWESSCYVGTGLLTMQKDKAWMIDTSPTETPFPTSLSLGVRMEGEEVRLSDDDNLKHLVVLGRSGCGKTSFLLGLLYQQIQRGGGYIFIDGKVSRSTIDQVYYLSKLAMRESLFRIFNPSDPMITHTYKSTDKGRSKYRQIKRR